MQAHAQAEALIGGQPDLDELRACGDGDALAGPAGAVGCALPTDDGLTVLEFNQGLPVAHALRFAEDNGYAPVELFTFADGPQATAITTSYSVEQGSADPEQITAQLRSMATVLAGHFGAGSTQPDAVDRADADPSVDTDGLHTDTARLTSLPRLKLNDLDRVRRMLVLPGPMTLRAVYEIYKQIDYPPQPAVAAECERTGWWPGRGFVETGVAEEADGWRYALQVFSWTEAEIRRLHCFGPNVTYEADYHATGVDQDGETFWLRPYGDNGYDPRIDEGTEFRDGYDVVRATNMPASYLDTQFLDLRGASPRFTWTVGTHDAMQLTSGTEYFTLVWTPDGTASAKPVSLDQRDRVSVIAEAGFRAIEFFCDRFGFVTYAWCVFQRTDPDSVLLPINGSPNDVHRPPGLSAWPRDEASEEPPAPQPQPQPERPTATGVVDGTRYAPDPDGPTDVRAGPDRSSALVRLVNNAESYTAECKAVGERITDSRGTSSRTWWRVRTPSGRGYISDVWFRVAGDALPTCDQRDAPPTPPQPIPRPGDDIAGKIGQWPVPTGVWRNPNADEKLGNVPQGSTVTIQCERYTGVAGDGWWYRITSGASWPAGWIVRGDVVSTSATVPECG